MKRTTTDRKHARVHATSLSEEPGLRPADRLDLEHEPMDAQNAHPRPARDRRARNGVPVLSVNEDLPFGFSAVTASPISPTIPSAPAETGRRWARAASQTTKMKKAAKGPRPEGGRRAKPERPEPRLEEEERAQHQARHPADGEDPVARHLDLQDEEHDRQQNEEDPRRVHRQALEGEERQNERDAADHAGQNGPRMVELQGTARGFPPGRAGRPCWDR